MLHESRIIYERGRHWAYEEGPGHFTVWQNCASGCGATKCATVAFPDRPEDARARAINEVNRREDGTMKNPMATKQAAERVRLRHARARRDSMLGNWDALSPAQRGTAVRYAARVALLGARLDQ